MNLKRMGAAALAACGLCAAQKYYSYVGDLSPDSVLLAWGTTTGPNTIGRSSPSHGEATIRIDGRTLTSRQNWIVVAGLKPDTQYAYQIELNGRQIASNQVRTWAAKSDRVAFFVIGDWGNGSRAQYRLAEVMLREFEKRSGSNNPIRFVLSTGDNIYGDLATIIFGIRHTGANDSDWGPKFFAPYEGLIAHVPFFPTLGNHDGNETENQRDLPAYLDNFFFPSGKPARWYRFSYGDGLADFFALDSTANSENGPPRPAYAENTPQWTWMQQAFPESKARWRIAFYHHPMFNAGPLHAPNLRELAHWLPLMQSSGVRVVFNGHEHNFQFTEVNQKTAGIRFVTSGAGGELRPANVQRAMKGANIAGWAPQNHFLVVEIEGGTMRITPVSWDPVNVVDAAGKPFDMPLVVNLP